MMQHSTDAAYQLHVERIPHFFTQCFAPDVVCLLHDVLKWRPYQPHVTFVQAQSNKALRREHQKGKDIGSKAPTEYLQGLTPHA